MKSSGQFADNESGSNQPGVPRDPFAVDFFGGRPQPAAEADHYDPKTGGRRRAAPRKKSDWFRALPRVANAEAEVSELLQKLPAGLTSEARRAFVEALSTYCFSDPERTTCSVRSLEEVNLNESAGKAEAAGQIVFRLDCRNVDSAALVAVDRQFGRALVAAALGESNEPAGAPEEFSPVEMTVLEFLALGIAGGLNEFIGEPLLGLEIRENAADAFFRPAERGVEAVVETALDEISGFVRIIAPPAVLNGIGRARRGLTAEPARKTVREVERIVERLDLRLQLGATTLDADSLTYLEPEDIILVEQPRNDWKNGFFDRELEVAVGRGRNFRLRGIARKNESSGEFELGLGEIISEEARRKFTPAKFKMDEIVQESIENEDVETENFDENADPGGEEISAALENVQVALRVEIAGTKMSLRELQALRPGQLIALGCRPTDPVRLVTDNNEEPVATGELIEIEGQLGVRLLKVFI